MIVEELEPRITPDSTVPNWWYQGGANLNAQYADDPNAASITAYPTPPQGYQVVTQMDLNDNNSWLRGFPGYWPGFQVTPAEPLDLWPQPLVDVSHVLANAIYDRPGVWFVPNGDLPASWTPGPSTMQTYPDDQPVPTDKLLIPEQTIDPPEPVNANVSFVEALYEHILNRVPEPAGLDYWVEQLRTVSRQQITVDFLTSQEFYEFRGKTDTAYVTSLYETELGREPDSQGLNYWVEQLADGMSRTQVAWRFV